MEQVTGNGVATRQKHHDLKRIITMELMRLRSVNRRFKIQKARQIIIVDTHCGPGMYTSRDGSVVTGSPLHIDQCIVNYHKKYPDGPPATAWFNDIEATKAQQVRQYVQRKDYRYSAKDAGALLREVKEKMDANPSWFFIIFIDPNNLSDYPAEEVVSIRENYTEAHVIINFSKTNLKRLFRAQHVTDWKGKTTFVQWLNEVGPNKKSWIRKFKLVKSDPWHWCLLVLFSDKTGPTKSAMLDFVKVLNDDGTYHKEVHKYNNGFNSPGVQKSLFDGE